MSTKAAVLEMLERNRDEFISGEQLGHMLNISRVAINKAIKELRQEGYGISASTNKGYQLCEGNDIISAEGIRAELSDIECTPDIRVYKTVDSTNLVAKQWAHDGAQEVSVVIANEQTAGRGRMGRSFYSPANSGIYMSIILRPNLPAQTGVLITSLIAVTVCEAIERVHGISPQIKWVNDIYINGKKVCGISTEAVTDFVSGNIEHLVLGIGINISTSMFPHELADIACSLQSAEPGVKPGKITRNALIAEILRRLSGYAERLRSREFLSEYKRRSVVLGKEIRFMLQNNEITGRAIDIDDNGGLVVQLTGEADKVITLSTGEISIRGDFH